MTDHIMDETNDQVEIVSVTLPEERQKNQILWYFSLLIVVAIITYMTLQWWVPKYHSTSQIKEVSYLYKEFKRLQEESAIDTREAQLNYDERKIKRDLLALDGVVNDLSDQGEKYSSLVKEWEDYSRLLRHNLPSREVINYIPEFEANLEHRHAAFITLIESFAQDVDYKRSFSIETVRRIEQLVIKAYKIEASLNRLLSVNLDNKADALATLTNESNKIEEIFLDLRQGSPISGVQSLQGTLEEESLNEIEFAFEEISADIQKIVTNIPRILELQNGLEKIKAQQKRLDQDLQNAIVEGYTQDRQIAEKIANSSIVLIIAIALAVVLVGLIYTILKRKITQLRFQMRSEREQNEYHEAAILKLIDQLEFLAKGDLSIELTVTDDSTGIIADSVNVAIGRIRYIVDNAHRLKDQVIEQLKSDHDELRLLAEVRGQFADHRELTLAHVQQLEERMEGIERRIHLLNMTDRNDEEMIREHIRILSELIESNNLSLAQMKRETAYSQRREIKISQTLESFESSIQALTRLMEQLEGALSQFVMPTVISKKSDLGFQLSEIKKQE